MAGGRSATVDRRDGRNYRYYMKPVELKVTRIGNSRGVRLPASTLERYRVGDTLVMEERSDGILLRPAGPAIAKLSWEQTASEMAASDEQWAEWDSTVGDGLAEVEWKKGGSRRAERSASPSDYRRAKPRRK
ncbi:MAG TPA: AbrB/MazE/SpoVT family DNA-binding domain-containing protein [Gemmatimonadaceae bacterium]|jgi:antitoxin component of MazEF toxin-antitoxin module|nr:AbrB/MazE/SpoVT family DNA-binding domain-containing protein [Gemmatimonadaceae bacterium]